jgi:general secretion pathway protein K
MNRRGFALLTVLWVLVALATLAGASSSLARRGTAVTRNRIHLTRAAWAREACGEILAARFAGDRSVREVDTIELGRGTWCRVAVSDPAGAVNVNLAPADMLQRLLGDSLADPLLDWRDADDVPRPLGAEAEWYRRARRAQPRNGPLADAGELRLVRGFERVPMDWFAGLTMRGSGRVNPNLVSRAVLAALPGLDAEVIEALIARRSTRRPIASIDELIAATSPSSRIALLAEYRELAQITAFAPALLLARIEGGVRGTPLVSTATLTLVPVESRLAIVARESD